MKKILLLLVIAGTMVSSCRYVRGKKVRGNGNVKTEDRSVTSFSGVRSYGSFDVYIANGSQHSLKVEGEENLLQFIETYVDNGDLKIKTKEGYWLDAQRSLKIFVTSPHFSKIASSGSGNIISESKIVDSSKLELSVTGSADIRVSVDVPEVEASITGSGNMNLDGQTKMFTGKVSGSGNIRAMDLKAEETNVRISGSGNADVYASVQLDVHVAGSGDVRYKGEAKVNSNIAGSGNVKKVD
jgi:hypothetical protein